MSRHTRARWLMPPNSNGRSLTGPPACCSSEVSAGRGIEAEGLLFQEGIDALGAELAAGARVLVPTERRAEPHAEVVHRDRAGADLAGDVGAAGRVGRPDR